MNEIIISQIRQRLEILYQMVDELERSGGGGGEPGTTNYNDLTNKPSVNGHILIGSKTSSDLDLQPIISDLSTIRSGAAAGATAVQPATMNQALRGKQNTLTFDSTPTSGSTNPVTSGGVYTSLTTKVNKVAGKGLSTNDFTNEYKSQIETNTEGIGAVANVGAKNLLDYTFSINGNTSARTSNGVTFTINADRSISTSGTASANVTSAWIQKDYVVPDDPVILSGCPAGGADNKYRIDILDGTPTGPIVAFDYGNGAVIKSSMFTSGIGIIRIRIESGQNVDGLVFKPMIRPASITDDTYVPYAPTNRELYEDKADQTEVATIANRGSKNLLKIFATTQTVNGITFTVNSDDTITINGTATAAATLTLATASQINSFLPLGTYKLSGCTGGSTATYDLRFYHPGDNSTVLNHNGDTLFTRDATKTDSNISILVRSGQVMDNVVIKPMIRDASIENSTYVPYAPTNRELYEMILALQ